MFSNVNNYTYVTNNGIEKYVVLEKHELLVDIYKSSELALSFD
jgi:hypothetical protein